MATFGTSNGKRMTWERHLDNHPNEKERNDFKRLQQLHEEAQSSHFGKRIAAEIILLAEFGPQKDRKKYRNKLRKKILKGWIPLQR